MQERHLYEFGPFRLDPVKRRLLRDGEPVQLTPKAFETLLALVQQSGRTVEKDDLMRRVWPGAVVEENNLNQNITALRKCLGDSRQASRYIATIPGLGYRFVAEVKTAPFVEAETTAGADVHATPAVERGAGTGNGGQFGTAGLSADNAGSASNTDAGWNGLSGRVEPFAPPLSAHAHGEPALAPQKARRRVAAAIRSGSSLRRGARRAESPATRRGI